MIKIDKTVVHGWEAAILGARNPMNSWKMSDTVWAWKIDGSPEIGKRDMDLMERLVKAGSDHRKFLRFLTVTVIITAPLYWWKEYDTYKVGTVANSCSTMHKIHAKEFTLDDFSHEHLIDCDESAGWLCAMKALIRVLNVARDMYLEAKDNTYWWQMIQLLPTSYNQTRTVLLNYEVLRNMYHARKNHKLDEWVEFCRWVEDLPYADHLITEKGDAG